MNTIIRWINTYLENNSKAARMKRLKEMLAKEKEKSEFYHNELKRLISILSNFEWKE